MYPTALQGQAGFGRLWEFNKTEWPHGLMGCVGSFGLGFMMPGMAYCMSSIISVLYDQDHAVMEREVAALTLAILLLTSDMTMEKHWQGWRILEEGH